MSDGAKRTSAVTTEGGGATGVAATSVEGALSKCASRAVTT